MTRFVGEHVYSEDEKRSQLHDFVSAMEQILASPDLQEHFPEALTNYAECLHQGRLLLDAGFTQADLSALSRSFQPVLWTHPHWDPPLIEMPDGSRHEPEWYSRFERLHEHAAKAAERLRVLGEIKYSD
jgi:hypothetical protein